MKGGQNKQKRFNEALGILFILIGVFTLISLLFFNPNDHAFYTSHPNTPYRNLTGVLGAYLAHGLMLTFGWSSFAIPILFFFWAGCFFLQKVPQKKWMEVVGIFSALLSISGTFSIVGTGAWKFTLGGALGYFISSRLETYFGRIGGLSITISFLALSLLLATDFLLYPFIQKIFRFTEFLTSKIRSLISKSFLSKRQMSEAPRLKKETPREPSSVSRAFVPPKVKKYAPDQEAESVLSNRTDRVKRSEVLKESEKEQKLQQEVLGKKLEPKKTRDLEMEQVTQGNLENRSIESKESTKETSEIKAKPHELESSEPYEHPPLSLLQTVKHRNMVSDHVLHENSKVIEETLRHFGIDAKVIEVEQGPVITRYELLPAPGVKVNSIASLSEDLQLALKTTSIRFLTPIPGKSAIGIEIPNSSSSAVSLKELLESPEYRKKDFRLPLILGKDASGRTLISDLAEMPHLLIAGATGSGKTVCLNSIIIGFLYTKTPEQLRLIMVDPKMVELAVYKELPHMMAPVVTDVRKASATLNWLVHEMERRYKIFAAAGMRNIQMFNQRAESSQTQPNEGLPKRLPYIVLVIDELADLMLVAREKVETAITRLAQLSRAVGIHLILATQRPSVDVITGVIKANFPARISFKVASKVDSRTVLDVNGADQLIGKGDMLFLEPGEAKPIRGQGTLISDEEINATVDFIKKRRSAQYVPDIHQATEAKTGMNKMDKDELYDEAVQVVLETRQASVSVLQRRLRLGYGRAARIIDMMEEEGIVGPFQGSKPRDILIDRSETSFPSLPKGSDE